MLFGRERELESLADLLYSVDQRGAVRVVRGAAGIGKSALLVATRERAFEIGFRVLTATGIQPEAHLPFAGLHQLLRPILDEIGGLPIAQRQALSGAFGMSEAIKPDRFLIALASLHLLADSAERTPLLLLVDDAQWLDPSSADALAFVARRLDSDPVVVLIAIREGYDSVFIESGLPEIRLEALDPKAAGAVLDSYAPDLPPAVRVRVLREGAGNPLALLELPRAMNAAGVGSRAHLPARLPLTRRLEKAFASRLPDLPAATRALLLIAALDESGDLRELLAASRALTGHQLTLDAVAPAVGVGLVEINDTTLRFSHPLMRSAIHDAASLPERQAAHAAIAEAVWADPDRHAWHKAASIVGTDEEAGAQLEEAAHRAQQRGSIAIAAVALEGAALLSDDPTRRGGRLLRAAELAYELGRHGDSVRLLRSAESLQLAQPDMPRLAWLRELYDDRSWSGSDRVRAFVDIANQMRHDGFPDRALNTLLLIALRCYWSNPDRETQDLVIASAEQIPVAEDDAKLIYILAMAGPEQRGATLLKRLSRLRPDTSADPSAMHLLGTAATGIGAFELAHTFLLSSVAGLRAQGRLGLLTEALVSLAWTRTHLGNWSAARIAAEEAGRLAQESDQPLWAAVADLAKAVASAYQGDASSAEAVAASAEQLFVPIGANPMLALVQFARGTAFLAGGRYDEAYEQLRQVFDSSKSAYHPHLRSWMLTDLIEAAIHSGNEEEAKGFIPDLEALAVGSQSPLLRVGLCYARALLAADKDAETIFLDGLGADLTAWPFGRARLNLAYGTWLRRRRRVAASRAPLRAARDTFDALGATTWSERARQELRAAGERSPHRLPTASDALTMQELQIAQLAAQGLTNKEIGQQLYLSPRTIGSHLYRMFPKLGVNARSQLRDALAGRVDSTA